MISVPRLSKLAGVDKGCLGTKNPLGRLKTSEEGRIGSLKSASGKLKVILDIKNPSSSSPRRKTKNLSTI